MRKIEIMPLFNPMVHHMLKAMGLQHTRSIILDQKLAAKRNGWSRRSQGKAYPYASLRQATRAQRKLLRKLRGAALQHHENVI